MVRKVIRQAKRAVWTFRWRVINTVGRRHQCYICQGRFHRFYPYKKGLRSLSTFVRQAELVGSDVENFGCPNCRSNDRERHLYLYFDRLELWQSFQGATILHFAPERNLSERIKASGPKRYVKADLYPADLFKLYPEVERMDVTEIPYEDNTFDFVICNHVLEHVADDAKAMSEIHRVLKRGGRAVLQTPFSTLLARTLEDPAIATPELRRDIYGQEDHLRLFGRDFLDRIQAAGLRLNLCKHCAISTEDEAKLYGVNGREDLILAEKV